MAEADEVAVREGLEKKAKQFGWVPKEQYKGAGASWLDAPEFVERGEQILPIVQQNNKRLMGQNRDLSARLSSVEESLRASDAVIRTLEESHEADTAAQVEATRKELKEELEAASRDGDHKGVADLTEQLTRLGVAEKKKPVEEEGIPARKATEPSPEMKAEIEGWYAKNPEYISNARRRALSVAISQELRQDGDTSRGAEFLDKVAEEVDKVLGDGGRSGHSRVAGDNGGGGRRQAATGGAKTYADLPAEAKAACDRQAARLVGPTRLHKDIPSWRASYTKQYFTE